MSALSCIFASLESIFGVGSLQRRTIPGLRIPKTIAAVSPMSAHSSAWGGRRGALEAEHEGAIDAQTLALLQKSLIVDKTSCKDWNQSSHPQTSLDDMTEQANIPRESHGHFLVG
jgi:hypothetical protein